MHHHRFNIHFDGGRERRGRGGRSSRGVREAGRSGTADPQRILLALLAEKPRHGYELVQEMAAFSPGRGVASPEMIYPALTYLEEIGHVAVTVEDNARKRYEITEEGRKFIESSQAVAGRRGARGSRRSQELWLARRELKNALIEKWDKSDEAQQQVLDILRRTTAELLGKPGN